MRSENDWPSGVVTFLFSDIEDSTPLWDRYRSAMRPALAEHDRLLQLAVEANGGVFVKSTGDGIMAAFAAPTAALSAALEAQRALLSEGADALRLTRSRHFAAMLDSELAHTLRQSGDLPGAAEMLRASLDDEMLPEEIRDYNASLAKLRQSMEPSALEAAWQAGRHLDLDSAVALALSEG